MIQTLIVRPHPLLSHAVCYYAIREIDCLGVDFLKPVCAKDEIHMMFLLNSKMAGFINPEGCKKPMYTHTDNGPECVFSGLTTFNAGTIVLRGQVKLLTIHFKPTGFFSLFQISPAEITDVLGNSPDLLSGGVVRLHEQMQEQKTNLDTFRLVDQFLLDFLFRKKLPRENTGLMKVTEFLLNQPGMYPVEQLASAANMSLKTFERRFVEQVGVYPKLYERLGRFSRTLNLKLYQPNTSWTEICFLAGYYDQNHFIKEFRKFTGMAPANFLNTSAPPIENIQHSNGY